ncbi:MAG: PQQ-dependent sugar dehydrogenase, partial [Cytophagales bacterium]|nr:PQQ-dependent sugar dehydrogenase [Cytophagales bacterium]
MNFSVRCANRFFQGLFLLFFAQNAATQNLRVADAFPNLTLLFDRPVEFTHAGDFSDRVFVVEQPGVIRVFPNNPNVTDAQVVTFLDIRPQIVLGNETGLLGLAFDPAFPTNRHFYVYYTRNQNGQLQSVVSRFTASAGNPNQADPASELVLLTFDQPFANHNGGKITFGPDGFLYIASGDGGSGGDPLNAGQDLNTLLGKILRIDVRQATAAIPYAIPPGNPFINRPNTRPEIFAYGLRNPWKISIDRLTGQIWAGDVGQNLREEIDLIVRGGNYGWRFREGRVCYNPATDCPTEGLIDPVWDYTHASGDGRSVTGGIVYRGELLPSLYGKYVYGDFASGNIWAITYDTTSRTTTNEFLLRFPGNISAFGEAQNGEMYICNYITGRVQVLRDPLVTAAEPNAPVSIRIFPNPANDRLSVEVKGSQTGPVAVRLYDVQGRLVHSVRQERLSNNGQPFTLDTGDLPPGLYVYRLEAG